MLYHPCTPERFNRTRVIDIFFMKNAPNYHLRVKIDVPVWPNFGHIFLECLRGGCSCNCIPISFTAQYWELYSQPTGKSGNLIDHRGGSTESKENSFRDGIIYIPNYEGDFILASHLYCLWSKNRIPSNDGIPWLKTLACSWKEHFLTPYLPMEGHLLKDVHCILIDNREHSFSALTAIVRRRYDRLLATEQFIEEDKWIKA
jgi:hypothetical protein